MKSFKIGNYSIGKENRSFFIAEVGINHDGNIDKAKELIKKAKYAGADAVKFQSFVVDKLWDQTSLMDLIGFKSGKYLVDLFEKVQLSRNDHFFLKKIADKEGIIFLSTPFDIDSVNLLMDLKVPAIKVASGDLTYHSFIDYIANFRIPVLLSTGMSVLNEVKDAVEIFNKNNNCSVVLLQCTSSYPSPEEEMDLNVIKEYERLFSLPAGISDHSSDNLVCLAAAASGAKVIEKHFTLNRADDGPDHSLSLNPEQLKDLLSKIRRIERILGSDKKFIRPSESGVKKIGRRSIFASQLINSGNLIDKGKLVCKRPLIGIPAEKESDLYGRQTNKKILKGNPVFNSDLKDLK